MYISKDLFEIDIIQFYLQQQNETVQGQNEISQGQNEIVQEQNEIVQEQSNAFPIRLPPSRQKYIDLLKALVSKCKIQSSPNQGCNVMLDIMSF